MHIVPYNEEVVIEATLVYDAKLIVKSFCDFGCDFIIFCSDFFPSDVMEILFCIPISHFLVGVFRNVILSCINNVIISVNFVCDFNCCCNCFRTPLKQLTHFLIGLEIKAVIFKSCLVDLVFLAVEVDAFHCVLNVRICLFNIVDVIGCNNLDIYLFCKLIKQGQNLLFLWQSVVLKLNIKVALCKH